MRPVRLDLDGFASFREPASIDFRDIDHFALVGPTGSGKSTIIDAITFALYGTAHRWERANAISYALAPTANRCTVSLIFDVSGQRYHVVREVRRVGQTIQQKAVRLERFLDATACPAPGDPPVDSETLVSEVSGLTPTVAELLGMDFDDFCQCVVLPQGEFARFLKAKSSDRQTILLKLLGAAHYDQIGRVAGARQKEAEKEVEMYREQLRGLGHATPVALAEATARREILAELNNRVGDLVAPVLAARSEESAHRATAEQATAASIALSTVSAPAGLIDRHAALTAATAEDAQAAQQSKVASTASATATREHEAGPQRARVEAAKAVYAEADRVRAALVVATQQATDTREATQRANEVAQTAESLERQDRRAADDARSDQQRAATHLVSVEAQLGRLLAVLVPADLDALSDDLHQATQALAAAEAAQQQARGSAAEAAAACAELPDQRTLAALENEVSDLMVQVSRWESDGVASTELSAARKGAETVLLQATATLDESWAALEQARTADAAAALRPALTVGHECPVCTQTVDTLPPPVEGLDLTTLEDAWMRARSRRTEAEEQYQAAARASETSGARHIALQETIESAAARVAASLAAVADAPPNDVPALAGSDLTSTRAQALATHVTSKLSAVRDRSSAAAGRRDRAEAEVDSTERSTKEAHGRLTSVQARADHHRATLVRAHTGLEADGAPPVDTSSVPATIAGWHSLAGWRDQLVTELESDQGPSAVAAAAAASETAKRAAAALMEAETAAARATAAAQQAAAEAAAAGARLEQLTDREGELTGQTAELPPRDTLTALLAEADRLLAARQEAGQAAEVAQQQAQVAADELQSARQAVIADRDSLSAARDRVATWSPPTFSAERLTSDLAGCFDELVAWSLVRTAEHTRAASEAEKAEQEAAIRAASRLAVLTAELAEHEVAVDHVNADPRVAERTVAVAHTRAVAEAERITEALTRRDEVVTKAEDADERSEVAGELRSLLRSNKFQQWLATAALDTLVADASVGLAELSDGQFTLTHENGDFFVVDHYDADSRRSVRTLSGGETFQASLALALALSEQLATLAVGGSARLDSIFLDEGFGTLDSEALDTVATTLESLAQGERMVGVITHVDALAERTPVRFLVSHDNRTSRVEREAG